MNKDYVVILGMHEESISMICSAHELNLGVIGIDINPESPGFKHCEIPLRVNAKSSKEIINILKKLAVKIVGITQLGIENQITLSEVANYFNLTHCGLNTSINTTIKNKRYDILKETEINIPEYQIAEDWIDVKMKYPFIIKPNISSGSRGVYLINNVDELKQKFNISRAYSSDSLVIVEEYLRQNYETYNEVSIEGFMLNDKLYITGFADRNYIYKNNLFIEIGGSAPSILSKEIQNKCKIEFEKAVRALGIKEGPTKGDLIIRDGKVFVIEVTSRLSGGGFCNKFQPLNNHTNIVKSTVAWACNKYVEPSWLIPMINKKVTNLHYLHDKAGTIKSFNFDSIKNADFWYINPNVRIGNRIDDPEYINRLCYIIIKDNHGDTKNRIKYIMNNIQIEID